MKIKHFFPGGNTADGFVNRFEGIIPPWDDNKRIFVLKGGPGVGKNTFMQRLGQTAVQKGYDVEYFHCASDGDSLDAVRIPKVGFTMLDGTAPHIIDPVTPGAVDGIMNLGVFLREDLLAKSRTKIRALQRQNSLGYQHTFAYLSAAGTLKRDEDKILVDTIDRQVLRYAVCSSLQLPSAADGQYPQARALFSAAITPSGIIEHMDTIAEGARIVLLSGPKAVAAEWIKTADALAGFYGLRRELFSTPLTPEQPAHLLLPDLDLCYTTCDTCAYTQQLDLTPLCSNDVLTQYEALAEQHAPTTQSLITAALSALSSTKKIHDDIETFYKTCMDFAALNQYLDTFFENLSL